MHRVGFHFKNLHNQNEDNAADFLFTPLMLSLELHMNQAKVKQFRSPMNPSSSSSVQTAKYSWKAFNHQKRPFVFLLCG